MDTHEDTTANSVGTFLSIASRHVAPKCISANHRASDSARTFFLLAASFAVSVSSNHFRRRRAHAPADSNASMRRNTITALVLGLLLVVGAAVPGTFGVITTRSIRDRRIAIVFHRLRFVVGVAIEVCFPTDLDPSIHGLTGEYMHSTCDQSEHRYITKRHTPSTQIHLRS